MHLVVEEIVALFFYMELARPRIFIGAHDDLLTMQKLSDCILLDLNGNWSVGIGGQILPR